MKVFVKKQISYNHLVFLERTPPKEGNITVKVGDLVKPFDVLGHTYISRLQESINLPTGAKILIKDEEDVLNDQVLFKKRGFIRSERGKTHHAGHVSLKKDKIEIYSQPEKFNLVSGIESKVAKIVEKKSCLLQTEATVVQGIWACGAEVVGEIKVLKKKGETLRTSDLDASIFGKILLYESFLPASILQKAKAIGALGVVCASVESSQNCPINLLMIEGFGFSRTTGNVSDLFEKLALRTGIISPERKQLILPGLKVESEDERVELEGQTELKKGARVQIIGWPYLGREGIVKDFLTDHLFESGLRAPAALIETLDSKEQVKVVADNLLALPT